MLATNPWLPQVEHIKSGTAQDFFEVNLNVFRSETIHRPLVRRLPVVLEVVFEGEELVERIARKKQGLRPTSRKRNPRSISEFGKQP